MSAGSAPDPRGFRAVVRRSDALASIDWTAFVSRYGLLLAWAAVIALFSILLPDSFPTTATLQSVLGSQAVLLILTLGMLFSLRCGEFDLSAAGVMSLSLVLVGYLNVVQGWPIGLTVAVALAVGMAAGAVNAFLVIVIGVESLIATLGMGTVLIGLGVGINSEVTSGISQTLVDVASTRLLGLPLTFYYAAALTLITWYCFSYTPLGRYLYLVGVNRDVGRLSGLPVNRIRTFSLVVTGLVSALAGVLLAGQLGAASPNTAAAFLLPAFAAALLGSTAISPGRFNAPGSFIAVYFLVTGITGLNLLGYSGWVEQVFYGGSLVVAVAFSRLLARGRVRKG